jgi:hypothetical protein
MKFIITNKAKDLNKALKVLMHTNLFEKNLAIKNTKMTNNK